MRKLLILGLVLMMGGMAFGAARNLYATALTTSTTTAATVTFPYAPQAFTVVNYDTVNTLEVWYGTNTFEVSPAVGPSISFDDCDFSSVTIKAKGTSGETAVRQVIAIY